METRVEEAAKKNSAVLTAHRRWHVHTATLQALMR